jgi:hypothetical protein
VTARSRGLVNLWAEVIASFLSRYFHLRHRR